MLEYLQSFELRVDEELFFVRDGQVYIRVQNPKYPIFLGLPPILGILNPVSASSVNDGRILSVKGEEFPWHPPPRIENFFLRHKERNEVAILRWRTVS